MMTRSTNPRRFYVGFKWCDAGTLLGFGICVGRWARAWPIYRRGAR